MIKEERTVVIDRPIEEVFAYVTDQTNTPSWQAGLRRGTAHDDRPDRRRHEAHIRQELHGPANGGRQRVRGVRT